MGQNTSVKSCSKLFNRALFISNIKRFFFLPVIHFLICLSAPLMIYSNLLRERIERPSYTAIEKLQILRESIVIFSFPIYVAIAAFLITLAVFSYLYTQKLSFMMHSFPISRRSMFFTSTIVSLLMLIIPTFLASVISISMTTSIQGGAESICQSFVLFLLEAIFFVGLTEFVIMCTGTIIAVPILYGIINILIPAMEMLIKYTYQPFIYGYSVSERGMHTEFAPIIKLTTSILLPLQYENNQASSPLGSYFENINYFLVVAIVGIVLLAISYVIYQKKHVESVGSVLPMRWTRPIMRWGVTLCAIICINIILQIMLFEAASVVKYRALFIVVTIVVGTITFFASQMVIQRSFRIFNKSLNKECIEMLICFSALCVLISFDVFGIAKKIPNPESIEELRVNIYGTEYSLIGENMNKAIDIQKAIVKNKDELIKMHEIQTRKYDKYATGIFINYSYYLKNGGYIARNYYVPSIDDKAYEKWNILCDEIVSFFDEPEVIKTIFLRGKGGEFIYPTEIELDPIYSYDSDEDFDLVNGFHDITSIDIENKDEIKKVTDAVLKDIEEGNLKIVAPYFRPNTDNSNEDFKIVSKLKSDEIRYNMNVVFTSKEGRNYNIKYPAFITVDKNCKNLYSALKEVGKMK